MTNFKLCLEVKHSNLYKYTVCACLDCCHTCQTMPPIFLIQAWLGCLRILRAVQMNVLGFYAFGGQILAERNQPIKGKERGVQL